MLFNIIKRSFVNQKKAMAVMVVSVAVGTAIAASLIALALDIETKVSRELRSFGANIIIRPRVTGLAGVAGQKRWLREEDLPKVKTIFWRHNILGAVPLLYAEDAGSGLTVLGTWYHHAIPVPGEVKGFETGVFNVMPWWSIRGRWPEGDRELLAGSGLARRMNLAPGSEIEVFGTVLTITGIVSTGGKEDDMLVGELDTVQKLSGLDGRVSKVLVSALTTPMDDFAYKDPEKMTRKEYEKWYCTGYVTSIAKQLEEVFAGAVARPVWPVAQTEGRVLKRLKLLIYLLTAAALLAAALSVSTTMIMSLLRRTDEVALMKALGADRVKTVTIFLAEALIIGLVGGLAGYALSFGISEFLGQKVFGAGLKQRGILFPVSLGMSVTIAVLGVYLPLKRALAIRPAVVLKGE